MPDGPTTKPAGFSAWWEWRAEQKSPPPTIPAALDELHRLAVAEIVEIVATQMGLLSVPEVVAPDEVARRQLVFIPVRQSFGFGGISIPLSGVDLVLRSHVPNRLDLDYRDLNFHLTDLAAFTQYLNGDLAEFGLSPPAEQNADSSPHNPTEAKLETPADYVTRYLATVAGEGRTPSRRDCWKRAPSMGYTGTRRELEAEYPEDKKGRRGRRRKVIHN